MEWECRSHRTRRTNAFSERARALARYLHSAGTYSTAWQSNLPLPRQPARLHLRECSAPTQERRSAHDRDRRQHLEQRPGDVVREQDALDAEQTCEEDTVRDRRGGQRVAQRAQVCADADPQAEQAGQESEDEAGEGGGEDGGRGAGRVAERVPELGEGAVALGRGRGGRWSRCVVC